MPNPEEIDSSRRRFDPRFPNRPTHDDVLVLAQLVAENDAVADDLGSIKAVVQGVVDEDSLVYLADQRALRLSQVDPNISERTKLIAMFIDAFVLGYRYAKKD